ncbi:E3 ubiquitin-protein like [Actinidia chinensis var. chinensis]|uniref:E3 ubiquitin-protein like n=1 Tax=Actinidia chinensis var. chinensis TaxID=1590841 RepID=A0A2R6R338_ACTCC|nr:E3 ubiquitin-protein like [Actinidia chinensis var. chinensis]
MGEDEQRTETSRSTSNPCPICLGPLLQESYLDQCFHKFCYNCIVHWTKVVAGKCSRPPSSVKCPLCKTENFSIVHGYDGNSFQQHYINQDLGNSAFFSETHKCRLQCYYIEPVPLTDKFKVSWYWKSRKYLQSNQWLQNWLRREIQALIQEEDVEIIVHHILGVIDSLRRIDQKSPSTPETKQENFKALVSQAARPFLTGRTDRFVNEVELFLASGLNIEAYDKVYAQHLGWKLPGITAEDEETNFNGHEPSVPYLYFFDDDSDGIE